MKVRTETDKVRHKCSTQVSATIGCTPAPGLHVFHHTRKQKDLQHHQHARHCDREGLAAPAQTHTHTHTRDRCRDSSRARTSAGLNDSRAGTSTHVTEVLTMKQTMSLATVNAMR